MSRLERGSEAIGYVGVFFVAFVLVFGVIELLPGIELGPIVKCAISSVSGQASQCDETVSAMPDEESESPVDSGDREMQRRESRISRLEDEDNRERRASPSPSVSSKQGKTGKGTSSGLAGPGFPGTKKPKIPDVPAWPPRDEGSGLYASESPNAGDYTMKGVVGAAANATSGAWPEAAKNLHHYLENSGKPLEQDVDGMLKDSVSFKEQAAITQKEVIKSAISEAKGDGGDGPITYPVNTGWNAFYFTDSDNWFYALGGISYNWTGYVTVFPPSQPGGEWSYDWFGQVNIYDRYNWDGTKSTNIGPFNVTDKQLGRFHVVGLAQEYDAVGSSSQLHEKGSLRP